jgi:hypothetical protein
MIEHRETNSEFFLKEVFRFSFQIQFLENIFSLSFLSLS